MGGGGCTSEPVSPFGRGRGVGARAEHGERGGMENVGGTRPGGHGDTGAQGQAPTGTSAHRDTEAPAHGWITRGRPTRERRARDRLGRRGRGPTREPRPRTGPGNGDPGNQAQDRPERRDPGPDRETRPRTGPRARPSRKTRPAPRPNGKRGPGADRAGAHHYPVGPTTGSASPGAAAPAAPCRISLRTSSTRSTGSKGFARKASTPSAFPLSISYCVHALMIATGT